MGRERTESLGEDRMLEAVVAAALPGKAEEALLLKKRVKGVGQPGPASDPETSSLLEAHGHPDWGAGGEGATPCSPHPQGHPWVLGDSH